MVGRGDRFGGEDTVAALLDRTGIVAPPIVHPFAFDRNNRVSSGWAADGDREKINLVGRHWLSRATLARKRWGSGAYRACKRWGYVAYRACKRWGYGAYRARKNEGLANDCAQNVG
jgi:hypothetical protein